MNVIAELLQTEKNYIKSLQMMIDVSHDHSNQSNVDKF